MAPNNKLELIDNQEKKQFEININGRIAFIKYIFLTNKIILTHTEVPKELTGKKIGSALVKKVLENIEKRKLILIPLCPFVAAYIKRHPEWKRIVDKSINI